MRCSWTISTPCTGAVRQRIEFRLAKDHLDGHCGHEAPSRSDIFPGFGRREQQYLVVCSVGSTCRRTANMKIWVLFEAPEARELVSTHLAPGDFATQYPQSGHV